MDILHYRMFDISFTETNVHFISYKNKNYSNFVV
jgi:hypothetical protein